MPSHANKSKRKVTFDQNTSKPILKKAKRDDDIGNPTAVEQDPWSDGYDIRLDPNMFDVVFCQAGHIIAPTNRGSRFIEPPETYFPCANYGKQIIWYEDIMMCRTCENPDKICRTCIQSHSSHDTTYCFTMLLRSRRPFPAAQVASEAVRCNRAAE